MDVTLGLLVSTKMSDRYMAEDAEL